ncbi:hypothetical protein K503DRAFT_806923 [Rhizopogon vinicolor AM-OR11-026]|uniref:Uncharacterized protein n=1 Tax=Rhizopogon vinicolor AM-OR11-026 TaxID=1314800 RepID=A0A1B7MDH0_9AGAM|nr:hypothetical protein K503DRAFT_806923 [Rhizopogon vinicolor AM-OR11-026]
MPHYIIFDSSSPLMFLGCDTNIASAERLLLRKKGRITYPEVPSNQTTGSKVGRDVRRIQ